MDMYTGPLIAECCVDLTCLLFFRLSKYHNLLEIIFIWRTLKSIIVDVFNKFLQNKYQIRKLGSKNQLDQFQKGRVEEEIQYSLKESVGVQSKYILYTFNYSY